MKRLAGAAFALAVAGGLASEAPGAATQQSPPPTLNVTNTSNQAPSGPPVEIEDCKLAMIGKLLVAKTGKLTIEFTNEGKVVADLLRFRVMWGADGVAFIRDQGSFAPGITVKHEFRQSEGELVSPLFSHPDLRCFLESAHFIDGTMWTNPASAAGGTVAEGAAVQIPTADILGDGFIGVSLVQTDASSLAIRLLLPGSPAEAGGLRQGDIVDRVNGQAVRSLDEIVELVSACKPGQTLTFEVKRQDADLTIKVVVGSRAATTQSPMIL